MDLDIKITILPLGLKTLTLGTEGILNIYRGHVWYFHIVWDFLVVFVLNCIVKLFFDSWELTKKQGTMGGVRFCTYLCTVKLRKYPQKRQK